ncbi:MAG TPA: long-chain fatty acid--CoA ligase [Burkholderiales bacterium]|nr:long-chain fatty acid--CoA ligase [Burkholderiales bacterium]
MKPADYKIWPKQFPKSLSVPRATLWHNLEVAAARYPDKPITIFYDSQLGYGRFRREAEALAGWLQQRCGVQKGERVLLDMQNSPQFMLGYYACLRADAVVVPVSPMNVTDELEHYVADSGARVALIGQEVYAQFRPLLDKELEHVLVATYSDYLSASTPLEVPAVLGAPRETFAEPGVAGWREALALQCVPGAPAATTDDLSAILYTSGTTGKPKGCMHTHGTVMCTAVGGALWEGMAPHSVALATAPMFHVTGMQHSLNAPIFMGASIALLPRWDPAAAAYMIERYRVTHWANVPTMVVDLLAHPDTERRDLSSLQNVFGGGASMPEAVAQRLYDLCGIEYMEAYGMTETISQTHINPPGDLRKQCLGIPTFDTESMIVDPDTLQPLPPGETGEILSCGPQLFKGYWNNPQATAAALVQIGGRQWLRTGDLGRVDQDGFFYIADRLKRMINAAGYKVWPAELEATLYKHPDIKEVAIVSAPDPRRGETVKAYVVLKDGAQGRVSGEDLIAWCRQHMAAYKVPRQVQFLDALPRSGTGKIQWRTLQEKEWAGGAS